MAKTLAGPEPRTCVRVAVVTGAAGDIGAALVSRLLSDGWCVAAVDIDQQQLRRQSRRTEGDRSEDVGQRRLDLVVDLTDASAVTEAARSVEARFGRLDAIVANAGGSRGEVVPFLELTVEHWRGVLDRNLTTVQRTCSAFLPLMIESGGGSVVVTTSELASLALPGFAAYAAAKGGVQQLVRGMAVDLASSGVRVNAVAPGPTVTRGTRARFSRPEVREGLARAIPLGRPAEPEELIGAYLLLLGEGSTFITGSTLLVDGGLSAL